MFDKQSFYAQIAHLIDSDPGNRIAEEEAIVPECVGLKMYDAPLIGYADAVDPLFEELKKPGIVGPQMLLPGEWLTGAQSVISLFLPFSEEVRSSNRKGTEPSPQWLHARVEGQRFIASLTAGIVQILENMGYAAAAPCIDTRFRFAEGKARDDDERWKDRTFTSNWSERHTAFAAGLGTFGLSKGLITEKGMAGRFTSIITTAKAEPDVRPYTGVYEYCIMCGACAAKCPINAISMDGGKDHILCAQQVDLSRTVYAPRYGCGKCQVGVPCEFKRP